MTQAKGALMQLLGQREATFRTAPVTPAAMKLPFTKWNIGRDPRKVVDPSISSSPLPGKTGNGSAIVQGNAETIFDLRTAGFWLSLLMGVPTAHKAVTKQPTNVTGVTIHYAKTATPTGNGTLTYNNTGKLLSWAAQGETAGATVDVTLGGRFTLASSAATHDLVVEVDAATLPTSNKSDTDIAVSGTLKAHVFPFDLNDRPSALMELGHTDIAKYYRSLGIKVNKLSYDITALEQNLAMDVIGGDETEYGAVWDGAPTAYNSVRAAGAGGLISNGATAALGTITGGTLAFDNQMEGKDIADGREGFGLIKQGEINLGGSMEAVFDGASTYALARAGTSTRIRIASSVLNGADTFGFYWDIPNAEFVEKVVPKEGKSGLFCSLDWKAHRVAAGTLPLAVLVNDVASY